MSQDQPKPILPEHMDRWTRNARLYETLKGMGLFVSPIPEANDPTRINHLIVSADLPFAEQAAQNAAEAAVAAAMQRPLVGERIGAPETEGDNVVRFSAKLG